MWPLYDACLVLIALAAVASILWERRQRRDYDVVILPGRHWSVYVERQANVSLLRKKQ